MTGPVLSVIDERRNGPMIAEVARLWIKQTDRVLDVTYGRGLFWTHFRPTHLETHDLAADGVDFRRLPEADGTFDVVVFDPPYISKGGRETSTLAAAGNDFMARYGLYDAPKGAANLRTRLIGPGIFECARVLAPGGRLLVKCMDYIESGNYQQGRKYVIAAAELAGLEQVDEFVHHSGTGPQPLTNRDGSPRPQLHSRRAHSVLCVFQQPSKRRATR